jgi:hypothetical protein
MTLNERLIDFLDGSLPADDEAELLHTLSVSPEKREMMRGFMEQRSLFVRDAKSLTVPYEAEQRLWARMDAVLPLPMSEEAATVLVPVATPSVGFFAHALSGASATLGAFTLVAGIGIGYFAGHSQTAVVSVPKVVAQTAPVEPTSSGRASSYGSNESHKTYHSHSLYGMNATTSRLATVLPVETPVQNIAAIPPPAPVNDSNIAPITTVPPTSTPAIALADIGGDGEGIKPMLHKTRAMREASSSLLSRFEFRIDESFGRQFPNSVATNVSLPLITNTSISTFFQVFPHSNLFWAGASYGSANITRKDLFTKVGDPVDPSQYVLASDTAHSQTSYVAALAELRLPAFEMADLTFTGGYGFATLGQMMFGEIGLHYDLSSEAGIQFGLRVLRFAYDLSGEKAAAIASNPTGSLAISNATAAASPSFNTELNAGLFFHF